MPLQNCVNPMGQLHSVKARVVCQGWMVVHLRIAMPRRRGLRYTLDAVG